MLIDLIGTLMLITGFVIGLGAVTVIDIHGFLGRKSSYWTEATTRTHKVTKPMIWVGIFLVILGELLVYRGSVFTGIPLYLMAIDLVLIMNGLFLSFQVSPYLLQREKEGRSAELLPVSWQKKITVSLLFSDLGWWVALMLVVYTIVNR